MGMRRLWLLLTVFFSSLVISLFYPWPSWASEGIIDLTSTVGQNARCEVNSVLMNDLNFTLLVNCRDLIYPPGTDLFSYVLWATPVTGQEPVRLGELGIGKAEFRSSVAFSGLFVTTEPNSGIRAPANRIVMQGSVQPIRFLEGAPQPTPQVQTSPTPSPQITGKVTPTPEATQGSELAARIRRTAVIFFLAFFGLIVMAIILVSIFRRIRE